MPPQPLLMMQATGGCVHTPSRRQRYWLSIGLPSAVKGLVGYIHPCISDWDIRRENLRELMNLSSRCRVWSWYAKFKLIPFPRATSFRPRMARIENILLLCPPIYIFLWDQYPPFALKAWWVDLVQMAFTQIALITPRIYHRLPTLRTRWSSKITEWDIAAVRASTFCAYQYSTTITWWALPVFRFIKSNMNT